MLLPWIIGAAFVGALMLFLVAGFRAATASRPKAWASWRLIWLLIICSTLGVALTFVLWLDLYASPLGSSTLLPWLPISAVMLATILILVRGYFARPPTEAATVGLQTRPVKEMAPPEQEPMKQLNFVSIAALMEDIGRGIGQANYELVTRSQTSIGALAVKTADVTVNFELTSAATRRGEQVALDAPLAGAKTLSYGTETFEEKHINRCSITLSIVSVAHKPLPGEGAGEQGASGQDVKPVTDGALPEDHAFREESERLLGVLRTLKEAASRLPGQVGQQLLSELGNIERMVEDGQLDAAKNALTVFAARHGEF